MMRATIRAGVLALALASGAACAAGPAAGTAATAASVRELLQAAHVDTMMGQVMQQMSQTMTPMLQKQVPCLQPQEITSALTSTKAEQAMIALVVPIYQRHLDEQDVRGLIAFYRSPLGQKLLRVQPEIMREAMLAGENFGRETVAERVQQLKQQGKLTAQGACPAKPGKP